ncbi:hypothetical protein VST7929_00567 [Vibrio stylophorae]|uniref:Prepilin-type N-terminal cleavage/methylation domain-containing protein n=1 Tax=Vibrio stylophorae TaxID=659351 RepID=A0ABN8DTL2_9VIBR|nr:prepilin-type N-terminal cleavage/methylation domain-containing protein [Vibrio stylophorae]CAH0532722.1 hypothetical protein VST7929_00567 [Vibrio stylophorae]
MVCQAVSKFSFQKGSLGFSLVELLIAMTLGLIVIGIVGTVYTSGMKNSTVAMKRMALYQSLNDAISIMALEIGRAGHSESTGETSKLNGATTSVTVHPAASVPVSSDCIDYIYRRKIPGGALSDQNGAFFIDESHGVQSLFWVKNSNPGVATMALCNSKYTPPLTDPDVVEITHFKLEQKKVTQGEQVSNYIIVHLEGRLRHDHAMKTTIQREIKVRNWD